MQSVGAFPSIPLVDLKAQYDAIKPEIESAIRSVIEQTAFIGGPFVSEFEAAFAEYCGVSTCVGLANGTDALFVALKALGIGVGDEVITAANSFIATSEAITMAGANVVFADVDAKTYLIDPTRVEEKITSRTKAIIPVHLYGQPADMAALRALATKHGLRLVGDAAQAHGAMDRGRRISELADVTCFSFYPGKNLGAYGDAGALVTSDKEVAARARMFANHGRTKKYDHDLEGINSRLDGVQAAILSVKLPHLDDWTEGRRRVAYRYNERLKRVPVTLPVERADVRAVYHLYVVRVPAHRRDAIQDCLAGRNISTGIHYPIALPYLNAYRHLGVGSTDFPVALKASQEILSLPIYPELSNQQVDDICDALVDALRP